MENTSDDARKEFSRQLQSAGRYLLVNGLTWGNAGNLSLRSGPDRCLITASGTNLGELGEDDFVELGLDGQVIAGQRKPSKEGPMHRAIYALRPEINAILHASPFYSTLLACSNETVPANWFVEDMYYLERVRRVPYFHPGSAGLADAVREAAAQANVLLLDNHGVLVYDTSLSEAMTALQALEMACRMLVAARSADIQMRPLPPETVTDFLQHSGYRKPRRWPAAAQEQS